MCDIDDLPAGARPVGRLADAAPCCRLAVWATRNWLDGPSGQQTVWNHFAVRLGAAEGRIATTRLEAYLGAIARHADRNLHRRCVACDCLSADEAMIGQLVECAACGACAGACAAAISIVRGDGVSETVDAAQAFGRSALRIGDAPSSPADDARSAPPRAGAATRISSSSALWTRPPASRRLH